MRWRLLLSLAPLLSLAHAEQPSSPSPVAAPHRELQWGEINFLHTTDTHGWLGGHLQEPNYSADWGDYVSFAEHLKEKAEEEGNDLLLIDTGDRIEGNGLYDASDPKGNFSREIFAQQGIDLINIGNHELYKKLSIENEVLKVVPHFKDNYLASNLDVIDPKDGERVPLAKRYKKFQTAKRKVRITAFGFLFNFKDGADNAFVQPVEETIAEEWFQDAIKDREVDLFLVIGHVPAHSDEYANLYRAIREKQWDTPIMFFGGHAHFRDYAIYDSKAHALASGRYFETVGFQSISGLGSGGEEKEKAEPAASPSFSRRYIDNNLDSYHFHTGLNATTFPTERGQNVSAMIEIARKTLDLDRKFGYAPEDRWINRAEYPSETSLYSLLDSKVVPEMVVNENRSETPRIIIVNTGAMRFDLFKGPVTTDSLYIVSPFPNVFRYIKDVPYETADRIITVLNNGANMLKDLDPRLDEPELSPPGQLVGARLDALSSTHMELQKGTQSVMRVKPDLTPGYTTKDDAGEDGDDTVHSPIEFFKVPNCFETRVNVKGSELDADKDEPPEKVDLVFIEFIEPWVLAALQFLGGEYDPKDVVDYLPNRTFTGLIGDWVKKNWDGEC